MSAQKETIRFKIDTGAYVTVIPESELSKLNITKRELKQTRKRLIGPTSKRLKCVGYTYTTFNWGDKKSREIIYVCRNLAKALLGKPAINSL